MNASPQYPKGRTLLNPMDQRNSRLKYCASDSSGKTIDTGVAGIHEGGTAFRMDDVPLPLRAPVPGPPVAAQVVRALAQRIAARRARRS